MPTPPSDLAVWLDFLKALLWPVTVLLLAHTFRGPVGALLKNLTKFKFGDAEVAFQAPSSDPTVKRQVIVASDTATFGPGGFLSLSGIESVLRSNGAIRTDEKVARSFQIFSTPRQRTWLAFTRRRVFCLLDDETTRSSGRIIQWILPREQATPIDARPHKEATGLLDIGARKNWLYSVSLFPTPESIVTEVRNALEPLQAEEQEQEVEEEEEEE
jgi:hypothetical protein